MINKYEILNRINKSKIMAIVRFDDESKIIKCFDALLEGNIDVMELSFTSKYANSVLEKLTQRFGDKALIGAGTILDETSCRLAILAGAKFIVSPCFNKDVAKMSNRYGIPYICGASTSLEVAKALEYGVDICKLFPATTMDMSIIKDLKAPFPNVNFIPCAGINSSNFTKWLDAGAFAVGVSSELIEGAKTDNYDKVVEKAKLFKSLIK